MEQIIYNMLSELQNGNNHVRGLSKLLKVNHMTIQRRMKELENLNIVDYTTEGRNKIYFIKNTIESRNALHAMEYWKLTQLLETYQKLRLTIEKIIYNKKIPLAIIFGSYAKHAATRKSDIDLYIETSNPEIKRQIQDIDSQLSIKIGKFDATGPLAKEIIKTHVIIKGVERYYELIHQNA